MMIALSLEGTWLCLKIFVEDVSISKLGILLLGDPVKFIDFFTQQVMNSKNFEQTKRKLKTSSYFQSRPIM